MPDSDLSVILSLAGTAGAHLRLATMSDDERLAMTTKAREARAAKHFERLKDLVDPNHELSDEERTRRAAHLQEARRAKAELDAARRAYNRRLLTEPLVDAEAS